MVNNQINHDIFYSVFEAKSLKPPCDFAKEALNLRYLFGLLYIDVLSNTLSEVGFPLSSLTVRFWWVASWLDFCQSSQLL